MIYQPYVRRELAIGSLGSLAFLMRSGRWAEFEDLFYGVVLHIEHEWFNS